jgi:hypothetical protein
MASAGTRAAVTVRIAHGGIVNRTHTVRSRRLALAALVVVAVAFGAASPALAKNPEDVFRGQVLTSKARFPTKSKSVSAYISKLKKLKTAKFYEDKDKKQWKVYYAAFFRKPLNDLEVTVRLYDVTGGKKQLINSFEQYLDGRGARSFISNMTLERKYVGVNKQVMIVLESRGSILAVGKFWIIGEAEKYSGKVDFSEEDTKGGD